MGMSKITFRADDALVERLDELDASKSEVMREALREFLDRQPGTSSPGRAVDDPVAARVDELLEERLGDTRDVNVTISVEGDGAATVEEEPDAAADPVETDDEDGCRQCGESVEETHAFCPNCGEEHPQQAHCECGEAVEPGWAFCPGCGRRSPTADVFDRA
jgi:Arc/MetJ-type ribon-helix-helix transcriptional regulator/RNA polymerase subunit RPABC4/transcription elongation factor Spt4